jgi:tetratricopeptide (TPR) repeat protein
MAEREQSMRTTFFAGSLVLLALVAFPAFGQSDDETAAKAAEQAGKYQGALQQYTAALAKVQEGSADDLRLREAIIRIVVRLTPKPAISPEARRFFVRGQTAFKEAKGPADMEEAAREFGRASRVAPWWPDAYMNQGIAYIEAGKLADAMRSLKLYLVAAPNAPDAQKVNDQIVALEYRLERSQKESVEKKEKAAQKSAEEDVYRRNLGFLVGRWNGTLTTHFERLPYNAPILRLAIAVDISIDGKEVKVTRVDIRPPDVILVGRVAGNDYSSIRWEFPAGHVFSPESVAAQVSPTRIYFSTPTQFESRRLNNFFEYDLRK